MRRMKQGRSSPCKSNSRYKSGGITFADGPLCGATEPAELLEIKPTVLASRIKSLVIQTSHSHSAHQNRTHFTTRNKPDMPLCRARSVSILLTSEANLLNRWFLAVEYSFVFTHSGRLPNRTGCFPSHEIVNSCGLLKLFERIRDE